MRFVITAGPTYEPLDNVRRLTNFSTGRLGTELARFLERHGHEVTLLLGEQATYRDGAKAEIFTTTIDLQNRLRTLANQTVNAVFHAAAVSDFGFGKVWSRSPQGDLKEIKSGKFSTREGTLVAELLPTPKIISELRKWYPKTRLVGWKFEVDGTRDDVIREAEKQLAVCSTDACVANGPAYGEGFGLVQCAGNLDHLQDKNALFEALENFVRAQR